MTSTADLYDEHGDTLQSCTVQLRQYGARSTFEGVITTVRCHHDNVIVKATSASPGRVGCWSWTAAAAWGRPSWVT